MDDPDTNTKAVRLVRRMYPDAKVFARARDRRHAWRLMDLGATVFRELFGSRLTMGEEVLAALGMPQEQADDQQARFRKHDNQMMRAQPLGDDDKVAPGQGREDGRGGTE